MKIIKRVSLLNSIKRINQPKPKDFKITRLEWNRIAPYRLTTTQQLYRAGYRNYKYSPWFLTAVVSAFLLGTFIESCQKGLADNQRQTLYRYKLRERQHAGLWLALKLGVTMLISDVIVANLYPMHEVFKYTANQPMLNGEEKVVRYHQYKHFMQNRQNKYDFLEIGVLQKFPYPKLVKQGKGPIQ